MDDDELEDYIELGKIGKGNGSNIVIKVKHLTQNKIFALKRILYDSTNKNEITRNLNEIKIFKEMDHPHIIKYYDSFVKGDFLYIVMEYAGGGDLQHIVKKHIESQQYIQEQLVSFLILKYFDRYGSGFSSYVRQLSIFTSRKSFIET